MAARDTIAAVATPPGHGGIGVVRVSGPAVPAVAAAVLGALPQPRHASLRGFRGADGEAIDTGIALYFPAPHSFTGEDVLELQGHGGPVVLDLLLGRVLELGARPARAGEFSERAFLEGRLDLAQAEAIADLIDSTTAAQARLAARTLRGALSRRVDGLLDGLTRLRTFVEAALDFPDEDIDFLADPRIEQDLSALIDATERVLAMARDGERVRDGIQLVIAGAPNAGKSSLLNELSGRDLAIVTAIPGTTRDLLHTDIQLDGLPCRIIDTAGLRPSTDPIEQEGMRRAREQIAEADHVLWIIDDALGAAPSEPPIPLPDGVPITLVRNKIDLTGRPPGLSQGTQGDAEVACSMRTGAGLDLLRAHLKAAAGYQGIAAGGFSARRRHLDALRRTGEHLADALQVFTRADSPELLAEELRQAQQSLGEITGAFSADDLLGRIFGSFCIGK